MTDPQIATPHHIEDAFNALTSAVEKMEAIEATFNAAIEAAHDAIQTLEAGGYDADAWPFYLSPEELKPTLERG